MTIDRRQLNAFLAVCECRTLGLAAQKLNLTQPAISRSIKLLEAEMGVPLFERHSLGMEMTAYARALLPHAELLASEGRRAYEEIAAMRDLRKGFIRVGAVTSVSSGLVPLAIHRLIRRLPGLEVLIVDDLGDRLRSELVQGTIDVIIAGDIGLEEDDELVVRQRLTHDTWSIFARSDHPCFAGGMPDLAMLVNYPWVTLPRDHPVHRQLKQFFAAAGMEAPRPTVTTRSISAMRSLVATGDFLSTISQSLVAGDLTQGTLRSTLAPDRMWKRDLFIYLRRRGILSLAVRAFISDLQRVSRDAEI